jgi:hypothetical protein
VKKLAKQTKALVGTGLMVGVGSRAIGSLGGSSAALTGVSGQFGTMGTLVGVGAIGRMMTKPVKHKTKKGIMKHYYTLGGD